MRSLFPSSKTIASPTSYSPEDLVKALYNYSPEDLATFRQALTYVDQQQAAESKVVEGGCTGPFKGFSSPGPYAKDVSVQGCVTVGPATICVGNKEADIGERIARAFSPHKGWSVCVGGGKCLDIDLIDLANQATAHGYRPILAVGEDESKCVLGFVPIDGSKGQLVADPYDAFKGVFGPLVAKGVSISVSIPL
jgi:hypothetical protein